MICSLKMLMTKAPFMEKSCPDEKGQVRWPGYPNYPGRANVSYISLQDVANRWHEKPTLTLLEARSPFSVIVGSPS